MAKIIECEQGSIEWSTARIGIPTASCFDQIITPKTGQLSKSAGKYMNLLIAEKLLNRQLTSLDNLEWLARGKELEPDAAKAYEFIEEVETKPVGFITTDDGLIGASPDRLIVGKAAGLELKCPAPQTHIGYMIEGFGLDYKAQVQGQMYVGELEYIDRCSYHPELPLYCERTERDDPFIKLLADALAEFNDKLKTNYDRIRASGFFEERAAFKTAHETAYRDQIEEIMQE